jgi:hypothetical protein
MAYCLWTGKNEDELRELAGDAVEKILEDSLGSGERIAFVRIDGSLKKVHPGEYVCWINGGLTYLDAESLDLAKQIIAEVRESL